MSIFKKKIVPTLVMGGILAGSFSFTANNAAAASVTGLQDTQVNASCERNLLPTQNLQNFTLTTEQEKQVDEIADQLKFLNEEALIIQDGNRTFDFQKIENKYGTEFTNMLKSDINAVGAIASQAYTGPMDFKDGVQYSAWTNCMVDALKDHFGVSIVTAALEGGLWAYLQKKAYKEAAKLLVKFALGTNAVALAGTLIYYGGKCTYTHG